MLIKIRIDNTDIYVCVLMKTYPWLIQCYWSKSFIKTIRKNHGLQDILRFLTFSWWWPHFLFIRVLSLLNYIRLSHVVTCYFLLWIWDRRKY